MRIPAGSVLVLVLSTALSGCLSGGGPPDGESDGDATASGGRVSIPWSLTDCAFANVFVPVDAAALEPYLPDGFRLSGNALPVDVPGVADAYLGVEAFSCAEGTSWNTTQAPMLHGGYFTSVEPPEGLRVEGVDDYYLRLMNLVPDEARRGPWQALGFPVVDGDATGLLVVDPEGLDDVSLSLDGDGTTQYVVQGRDVDPGGGGVFAEFMQGDRTVATWHAAYTTHELRSGTATLAFPEGSLGAAVLGTTMVEAPAIAGRWSFHDGQVVWDVPA